MQEQRCHGTWETPWPPARAGRVYQRKEGYPMGHGESDRSIVLRGGRADHMGKGATGLRSPHRKHMPDMIGRRTSCKPH